ncbi:malate dehydrogenase [Candidatus Synechococcus calcipolaris G9]|uniref:Malate dehydrogenase n=1 Tax=Candidatus Synechococcus calcipolaris G9 TaxID=1497997 RepID=A0ABT6EYW7_9SYNE|nr:malate dehydrogenase [Candidatus Synechococcus calcipolaris]MDG2990727.1 malate dehydrogenase [Candidatus Synechococcus calcipolaris G9]
MSPLVAILGAGNVGSALAQRLIEANIADVALLDVVPGRAQGLALDLSQAAVLEGHDRRIQGSTDYEAIAGADVVVITAGFPRKPGMSRDDLLKLNGALVLQVTRQAIQKAADAIFIVVTNPLDVMTYVAWQCSGLPPHRVLGMAGVLDSARFAAFIAQELDVSVLDIRAMVLGGHGDLMVPLPRFSCVNGIPITELLEPEVIDRLVDRTRNGGAEIVELLQSGSAFYAPASSTAQMVAAILGDRPRIMPVSAYAHGLYGIHDVYMGLPARISAYGVEKVLELSLTQTELNALRTSAAAVKARVDLIKEILPF